MDLSEIILTCLVGFGFLLSNLFIQFFSQPGLKNLNYKSHFLLLTVPTFLAILSMILTDNNHLNITTSVILSIVIGICSQMSLMVYFSAKHRLLWTLGLRNLLRNKRNIYVPKLPESVLGHLHQGSVSCGGSGTGAWAQLHKKNLE